MPRPRPHPKKYLRKLALRQPAVHGDAGIDLRPYQVILRPLVTEKGTHQSTRLCMMVLALARYSPMPTPDRKENVLFQMRASFDRASINPFCPCTIVVWSMTAPSESAR